MADSAEAYGISLEAVTPASIQRMLLIDYISRIELSRVEFISKRQEIIDLSKLIAYSVLYHKYDWEIFQHLIQSNLIIRWNRINPGNIIDERTRINDTYLEGILKKNRKSIHEIRGEILKPVLDEVNRNTRLLAEEKNIQLLLSEKFLDHLRPIIWFILLKYQGSKDYFELLNFIRSELRSFMEKSKIAEYLSLMILELLSSAENTNLQNYAKKVYKGSRHVENVLYDSTVRSTILKELEKQGERLTLSFKLRGIGSSIGTGHRLQVTIYNKESEYSALKESVNDKKNLEIWEKSLIEFYQDLPDTEANTELGMYYLSYLSEACKKVNIRFESNVNQILSSELTVITLALSF